MFDRIKSSFKHSAIYSLGNISSKIIGVVLIPVYTKYFTTAEYGIFGIFEITIFILTQVLLLGQPEAYLRFYSLDKYSEKRKTVLFTILIFLFSFSVLFLIAGVLLTPAISTFFSRPQQFSPLLQLSVYVIFLRITNALFLSVIRAQERSVIYSIGTGIKFLLLLTFNVYFVVFAKTGIIGIFYSYVISEIFLLIFIFPFIISAFELKFDKKILLSAISFGFPIIFLSMGSMILNLGDRYILKLLTNYREVGIYELGYRFGSLLNVFLVQSFALGFMPQAYQMYGKQGDKRYYSKMQTYVVFVLCWMGLGLSLFGKELIEIFALNSDFWPAYEIIPLIALAYIFNGARTAVSVALYLKKKTQYIAFAFIITAILNIGLNFALIPMFGRMGAAYATLISFFALYLLSYFLSNRVYRIQYENLKIFKMILVILLLYALSLFTSDMTIVLRVILKIFILAIFPVVLFFLNFYERIELERIKEGVQMFFKRTK